MYWRMFAIKTSGRHSDPHGDRAAVAHAVGVRTQLGWVSLCNREITRGDGWVERECITETRPLCELCETLLSAADITPLRG